MSSIKDENNNAKNKENVEFMLSKIDEELERKIYDEIFTNRDFFLKANEQTGGGHFYFLDDPVFFYKLIL